MRITVLGATGHTGRFVVRALREREVDVLACGRDTDALAKLKGIGVETRVVDVKRAAQVDAALRGSDGVANLAGPFLDTGDTVIQEAISQRVAYVDTTGEQAFMYAARARHHERARMNGVPIVNALAFEYAFADLATHAYLPEGGRALHVLYRARGAAGSAGTKKSIVRVLAERSRSHVNGKLVDEPPGARTHRFATLDGWRDGISFAGGEALTVPSHTPFRTVRSYLPGPPSRARTTRLIAPAARLALRGPLLGMVERAIDLRHQPPDNARATGEIYLAAQTDDDGNDANAWRHLLVQTPDPYLATGELVAEGIVRLARSSIGGVLAPAEALDARDVLDTLQKRHDGFAIHRITALTTGIAERHPADDKPI